METIENPHNIRLVDSSEFHRPEPAQPKKEASKEIDIVELIKKFAFTRFFAYAVVWFMILKVAYNYNLGHAYVCITGLVLILTNLGQRKKGELSAYSVFNEGGKKLLGTFNSNQLDPRYRNRRGQNEDDAGEYAGLYDDDDDGEHDGPQLQKTKLNKVSKMSNQPCYCGSGKKFKKCCYWRELKEKQNPTPKPPM